MIYINIYRLKKRIEIVNDDEKTAAPEFWNDPKEAEVFKATSRKKRWVESYDEIRSTFEDLLVLQEFAKEDPESEKELDEAFPQLVEKLKSWNSVICYPMKVMNCQL